MKAVIYARYSCDNQREESIEGQLRECKVFAERKGYTLVGTYIDRAMSAKTDNRPEFQRMIKESAKELFDVVIVWKLDRFARNRYDSAHYKATLRRNGVKVVSATEVISEGAEGIILESVLEGYAEYYSAELSEKVIRGMTENALKCQYNGGYIPMGYPRYQTAATKNGIVNHTVEHIRLTRKTDAHIGLFQHDARPGGSVADVGLTVPRFQQEVEVRHVIAVSSTEITEHSGFVRDHQQSTVLFKQVHKGFGRNIVYGYPAKVAGRNVADLCLEFGDFLSGNVFLLFKCFELALKQLSFCLHRVDVLLVVLVPVMSELDIRSLYKRDNRRLLEARLCYRQGVEYQRLSMVTLCRHTVNS